VVGELCGEMAVLAGGADGTIRIRRPDGSTVADIDLDATVSAIGVVPPSDVAVANSGALLLLRLTP
jgi:hypothetical protein